MLETEDRVLLEHKGYIPFTVHLSTLYFVSFSGDLLLYFYFYVTLTRYRKL